MWSRPLGSGRYRVRVPMSVNEIPKQNGSLLCIEFATEDDCAVACCLEGPRAVAGSAWPEKYHCFCISRFTIRCGTAREPWRRERFHPTCEHRNSSHDVRESVPWEAWDHCGPHRRSHCPWRILNIKVNLFQDLFQRLPAPDCCDVTVSRPFSMPNWLKSEQLLSWWRQLKRNWLISWYRPMGDCGGDKLRKGIEEGKPRRATEWISLLASGKAWERTLNEWMGERKTVRNSVGNGESDGTW